MVIDEGVLFRTTESAFVQTKRKLLDETDLWCIVSLPPGVFSSAGAGVKTNLWGHVETKALPLGAAAATGGFVGAATVPFRWPGPLAFVRRLEVRVDDETAAEPGETTA